MEKIVLFLLFTYVCLDHGVWGRTMPTDAEIEKRLKQINKPAVKTILGKNGVIIDCVDIYKQPAFDNPLLKNHTITELKPKFPPRMKNSTLKGEQTRIKRGPPLCPERTIPIRRTTKEDLLRRTQSAIFMANNRRIEEVAQGVSHGHNGSRWNGCGGFLNVWAPHVQEGTHESSTIAVGMWLSQWMWIRVGYMVNPSVFGDRIPRPVVVWKDNSNIIGINLEQPGFVQTDRSFVFGLPVFELSRHEGNQAEMEVQLFRESVVDGKWWVKFPEGYVGYFPLILFGNSFSQSAMALWGGLVVNDNRGGLHTTTTMGSGMFAQEGYGKAAYIRNMRVVDKELNSIPLDDEHDLQLFSTHQTCYSIVESESRLGRVGAKLFVGGPGGPRCA